MNIQNTTTIFFSATGTTKKVVQAVAAGIGAPERTFDFTKLAAAPAAPAFTADDFVIIGLPVYVGRVPKVVMPYLRTLRGNGTPCVIIGVYGNRHYDDFLVELEDIVKEQGFVPIAGAVFLGEHSFSAQLAGGRPNAEDLALAKAFGEKVRAKAATGINPLPEGAIPGNRPYRLPFNANPDPNAPKRPAICPSVDAALCTNCGACAAACPNGAINPENAADINAEKCIRCRACAHVCPAAAVDFRQESFWAHTAELIEHCSDYKKPVLVL